MDDIVTPAGTPDIPASIIALGIADAPLAEPGRGGDASACSRRASPIDRFNVGCRILHPLFDGLSITWTREGGVRSTTPRGVDQEGSDFRLSPFYVMLTEHDDARRFRLDDDVAIAPFPLLRQLREKGTPIISP